MTCAQSPCAASPNPESRLQSGFTLIELLVVVVIVGVLATALVISIGGSSERVLGNTAARFQALLGQACEQAELSGREFGVVVSAAGYAFQRLDGSEWRELDTDRELRARSWPDGLRLEFSREGRPLELATAERKSPQLVCFSSGDLTPFGLTLALGDARLRISGAEDATLAVERIEAAP